MSRSGKLDSFAVLKQRIEKETIRVNARKQNLAKTDISPTAHRHGFMCMGGGCIASGAADVQQAKGRAPVDLFHVVTGRALEHDTVQVLDRDGHALDPGQVDTPVYVIDRVG